MTAIARAQNALRVRRSAATCGAAVITLDEEVSYEPTTTGGSGTGGRGGGVCQFIPIHAFTAPPLPTDTKTNERSDARRSARGRAAGSPSDRADASSQHGSTQARDHLVIQLEMSRRDGGNFLWQVVRHRKPPPQTGNYDEDEDERRGRRARRTMTPRRKGKIRRWIPDAVLKVGTSGDAGWDAQHHVYHLKAVLSSDAFVPGRDVLSVCMCACGKAPDFAP